MEGMEWASSFVTDTKIGYQTVHQTLLFSSSFQGIHAILVVQRIYTNTCIAFA